MRTMWMTEKQLMPTEKMPKLTYSHAGPQAMVLAHYFIGLAGWDFWATEYDPATKGVFGYARFEQCPALAEWGTLSLNPLDIEMLGMHWIERDLHWTPVRFKEIETD
jgi:hypothetical protein